MENEQASKHIEESHHESHDAHQPKSLKSKWPFLVIAVLIIIVILLAGAFWFTKIQTKTSTPSLTPTPEVACTMDAKICPDGSAVGRSGPNCEFEACPATSASSPSFLLDKTYTSTDKWQIDYPGTFKLETRDSQQMGPNGTGTPVVISYLGPTQGSGTEFHDGVSFSIGVLKKPANQSIKDALDQYSKPNPELGGSRTELKSITVNGLSGYETTTEGLGSFRMIFLNYPGTNDKVYAMTIFADGPAPTDADYQAAAKKMVESFRNI